MAPERTGFRIIIVGGGIAGLTLANSLQHAQIDFLVLEARPEIAPQLGASIGLSPNGSRILDQLSCYNDLGNLAEPVNSVGYHDSCGNELCPRSDALQLVQARTNYSVCFLDRRYVLQVLAEHIWEKRRILLNKKVAQVDHFRSHVIVHCADGTSYRGDIVAGADGIASRIRREMLRAEAGAISPANKSATVVSAEYKCMFGISSDLPALTPGDMNVTHKKDASTLVINGKGGDIFWFLFVKMSQVYRESDIPRFTEADATALAQNYLDLPIFKKVTFGDLWKRRHRSTLLAMEEADYATWTWGRFACVGDSVHKMTPNSGAGGMAAIESAAALANSIHALLFKCRGSKEDTAPAPTLAEIQRELHQFHEGRKHRASEVVKASSQLTRIQAIRGLKEHLLVYLGYRLGGDYLVHVVCASWIGAPLLRFLPPPSRSLTASMSLDSLPSRTHKSTLYRAIVSIPFLLLSFSCFQALSGLHFDAFSPPSTVLSNPLFFASDPLSRMQMPAFLADIGLIYSILLVESTRRANMMSLARFPFIFGMVSFRGIGVIMPIYYFFYHLSSRAVHFRAIDWRLTDIAYTVSVLPAMVFGYYIPYFLNYLFPTPSPQYTGISLRHLFPLWISFGQLILSRITFPSSLEYDRLHHPTRDLRTIRITIATLAILSASIYLYCTPLNQFSLLYFPFSLRNGQLKNSQQVPRVSLQCDQFSFSVGSVLWIVYLFAELRTGGFMAPHWIVVLASLGFLSLVFGAGAATAVGWLWREEVLVRRELG